MGKGRVKGRTWCTSRIADLATRTGANLVKGTQMMYPHDGPQKSYT